jgi:SAM-dependent methyltransferase
VDRKPVIVAPDPARFPHFNEILELVALKSPLQKKKLAKLLATRGETFFDQAEEFATQYRRYLDAEGMPLACAVDAYLGLCADMMQCQIHFAKTGNYPIDLYANACKDVYNNESRMKPYMIGLAISQFLWPSHYEIFDFFSTVLTRYRQPVRSYLEIGPGHGLYLNRAIGLLSQAAHFTAVDISPTSVKISQSIIKFFRPERQDIVFHTLDMFDLDLANPYDFITMGEVLEHVRAPETLLKKLHGLLAPSGQAFVSTCVDAPAIDHVYHFRSVDEIRRMFEVSGLKVVEERVLPVEDLPMEEIIKKKITINYCALLRRA